jgi:hypothetical protein
MLAIANMLSLRGTKRRSNPLCLALYCLTLLFYYFPFLLTAELLHCVCNDNEMKLDCHAPFHSARNDKKRIAVIARSAKARRGNPFFLSFPQSSLLSFPQRFWEGIPFPLCHPEFISGSAFSRMSDTETGLPRKVLIQGSA